MVAPAVVGDSPFGSGYKCLEFNQIDATGSTSNGLNIDPNAGIIGTEDFCIEFWNKTIVSTDPYFYPFSMHTDINGINNGYFTYIQSNSSSKVEFHLLVQFYNNSPNYFQSNNANSYGIWTHWALVRRNGVMYHYCNGNQFGSWNFSGALVDKNKTYNTFLRLGFRCDNLSTYKVFNKKTRIYNFRITKGNPVYTGNFTPPTQPLTPVTGTQLLIC